MFWVTMGDLKKAFVLWNQLTREINEARKIKFLYNFID
jgi:hypothetical protein